MHKQEYHSAPLLKGANNARILQGFYPSNRVLNGCVYIVSLLKNAGTIVNSGTIQSLYFGDEAEKDEPIHLLESLLLEAGIDALYSNRISSIVWEKFVFLSPIASACSAHNKCIGALLENELCITEIIQLMEEIKQIAYTMGIRLSEDITEKTMHKLHSLPYSTNPSLHSDFIRKRPKTEMDLKWYFLFPSKYSRMLEPRRCKHVFKPLTLSFVYLEKTIGEFF